jgi:hypothetical protein
MSVITIVMNVIQSYIVESAGLKHMTCEHKMWALSATN